MRTGSLTAMVVVLVGCCGYMERGGLVVSGGERTVAFDFFWDGVSIFVNCIVVDGKCN
jgi:hypothetical protein